MGRVIQRFSKLDMDATADNAAAVLRDYPRRLVMAKRWTMSLQSPQITGMPRNDSYDNKAELSITGHIDDQFYVEVCENIIRETMPGTAREEDWAKILDYYYLKQIGTDEVIMDRLGYSRSSYYEAKKQALCAFAEWWPPVQTSDLLVYRS